MQAVVTSRSADHNCTRSHKAVRRNQFALALLLALGSLCLACAEHSSTQPPTRTDAVLHISATGGNAGEHFDILFTYLRQPALPVPLPSQNVAASAGPTQTLTLPIDLAPCLDDATHVSPGDGSCMLSAKVLLRNSGGITLDSIVLFPLTMKGGVTHDETITLRVAGQVIITGASTLNLGDTSTMRAEVRDRSQSASNPVISGRTVSWSSSNAAIATVSSTGLVTALTGGTVSITATSGAASGIASLTTIVAVATVAMSADTVFVSTAEDGRIFFIPQSPRLTGEGRVRLTLRDFNGVALAARPLTVSVSDDNLLIASLVGFQGTEATLFIRSRSGPGTVVLTATSEGKQGRTIVRIVPAFGIVDADRPTTASYSAGMNSAEGLNTITRTSTGNYTVRFAHLGSDISYVHALLVSTKSSAANAALAAPMAACNGVSYSYASSAAEPPGRRVSYHDVTSDVQLNVRCEDPVTGADKDAEFRAVLVGPGVTSNPQAWSSPTTGQTVPSAQYVLYNYYSSLGVFPSITPNADPPNWNGFLTRHNVGVVMPSQAAFVTAFTPNAGVSCQPRSQVMGNTFTDVLCFNRTTGAVNIPHQVVRLSSARAGQMGALVVLNAADGSNTGQGFVTSGTATTTRAAAGKYTVTLNGLTSGAPLGIVASAWGSDAYLHCAHHLVSSNPVTVDVSCFNGSGAFSSAATYIQLLVLQ